MTDTYLEIIDACSGDARETGLGAMFTTEAETRRHFEAAHKYAVENGGFLLDCHIGDDLVDTIEIDANGVYAITGEHPQSPEFYIYFESLIPLDVPVPSNLEIAFGNHPNEGEKARWLGVWWEPCGDESRLQTRWSGTEANWYAVQTYWRHTTVAPKITRYDLGSSEERGTHMMIFDLKLREVYVAPFADGEGMLKASNDPQPAFNKKLAEVMETGGYDALIAYMNHLSAPSSDDLQEIVAVRVMAQNQALARMQQELDDRLTILRGAHIDA